MKRNDQDSVGEQPLFSLTITETGQGYSHDSALINSHEVIPLKHKYHGPNSHFLVLPGDSSRGTLSRTARPGR